MDTQTAISAALVVPAVVLAIIARRSGRTSFGLGLRHGAVREFVAGGAFSLPFLVVFVALFVLTGLTGPGRWAWNPVDVVGIWIYFLVLMGVEEVVFRGLLMTGLGVVAGRWVALVVTALLVASAYAFAPHTGVLPVVGAVVTNLLHGWARWRSGRIWWGLAQRWVWNSALVSLGFTDSAFTLTEPLVRQRLTGPDWLTGGGFGVEGGVVGIAFLVVMLVASTRFARGSTGPWRIAPAGGHR